MPASIIESPLTSSAKCSPAPSISGGTVILCVWSWMAEIGTPAAIRPMTGTTARAVAAVIAGRDRLHLAEIALDDIGREIAAAWAPRLGEWRFGQLDHLERAGPVGHAPQEAALLERQDQAMDAGLGLEIQRILHFLERGRNAFLLQAFVDEKKQFELFAREHGITCHSESRESEQMHKQITVPV